MSIRCEHVHRLELRKSFTFWVAVATWQVCRKPRLAVIPVNISYFGHALFLFRPYFALLNW